MKTQVTFDSWWKSLIPAHRRRNRYSRPFTLIDATWQRLGPSGLTLAVGLLGFRLYVVTYRPRPRDGAVEQGVQGWDEFGEPCETCVW